MSSSKDIEAQADFIVDRMKEYAKKQAIAFLKYAVNEVRLDFGADFPMSGSDKNLEKEYDKFFSQQQTTNTDTKSEDQL
jgi:hypothetical protein